jgi:hypothetical protein
MRSSARIALRAGIVAIFSLYGFHSSRAAQVVLSDPLTSWSLGFGPQSSSIMLKNGAVHIMETGNDASWEIYPGFNFTDMDASITITPQVPTGSAAGLIFWATGPDDFVVFQVSDPNGTFGVNRRISANGGSWQTIVPYTQNAAVKTGAANTLRVVTQGNTVSLYLNGQSIGSVPIEAPAGGGTVGFEGEGQGTQPADYVYSNLSVSQ